MAECRKYGFGVIGCGVISDTHIDAINALPNGEVVAVCDKREDAAQAKAEKYGCDYYTDLAEMLKDDRVEVCDVVVPSGLHAPLGIQCADAGRHVICTKPIDITLEKIDALIDACDRNGVKCAATHQLRNYTNYKRLKAAVESGQFGKLLYGNAIVPWFRSDEYYSDGWHGTKKLDGGGALMNQSIHYIDLLLWVMGDVAKVGGFTDTFTHPTIEVEDCANAVLKFKSGAHGIIQGTTCTYQGHSATFEIHGSKGNAVFQADEIKLWEVEGEETECNAYYLTDGETGASDPKLGMLGEAVQAHTEQIADVLAAIEEDREPALSGREARRSVELITAIYKSSEESRMVEL